MYVYVGTSVLCVYLNAHYAICAYDTCTVQITRKVTDSRI